MEEYVGVKFRVWFLRKEPPADPAIERLAYWCRKFHTSGLTEVIGDKSAGNLSFRVKVGSNEFIITASGLGPKDSLEAGCFVRVVGCDIGKKLVYACGLRGPSSESILHHRIYELRPDVNAVFHGHDSLITGHAANLNLVETAKQYPYGSLELVKSVEAVLDENDFVIMKGHGFLSLGRGGKAMDEAGRLALEKQKLARQKFI